MGETETPRFDTPRLAINRVYTRRGDDGATSLAGGQRVPKHAPRIETYGTLDELSALIGVARESIAALEPGHAGLRELGLILLRVQHELFNAGSILATRPEDVHPRQARVTQAEVTRLEEEMDRMGKGLEPLRSFVLPGGCRLNAELHVCRTVCRRAERCCTALAAAEPPGEFTLAYLNRLSDAFFVWSRWASRELGAAECLWDPNQG